MGNPAPKQITGKKACLEFLKLYRRYPDTFSVKKIYLKEGFSRKFLQEFYNLNLQDKIEFKTREELDSLTGNNHQGILILYEEKEKIIYTLPNGKKRPPGNLHYKTVLKEYPGIYVLTDSLQDPQNLGSIIRTSESLGALGLFITGKGATVNPTVQKVATSSLLYLPVFQYPNGSAILKEARKLSYWIVATVPPEYDGYIPLQEIHRLPKEEKYIVLVGSEGDGLKRILLETADFRLTVPQLGFTGSLNAGQALAIVLYKLIEYVYLA